MVPVVQAMIDRGLGAGRDAQRAGERILEQVGVLRERLSDVLSGGLEIAITLSPSMRHAVGEVIEGEVRALPASQNRPSEASEAP